MEWIWWNEDWDWVRHHDHVHWIEKWDVHGKRCAHSQRIFHRVSSPLLRSVVSLLLARASSVELSIEIECLQMFFSKVNLSFPERRKDFSSPVSSTQQKQMHAIKRYKRKQKEENEIFDLVTLWNDLTWSQSISKYLECECIQLSKLCINSTKLKAFGRLATGNKC